MSKHPDRSSFSQSRRDVLRVAGASAIAASGIISLPVKAAEPVRIGLLGKLSQFNGEDNERMTKMAVEEINQAGGILGRQVELIPVDNEGKANKSIQAVQYLHSNKHVDCIVGGYASGAVLAIMPFLKQLKIPYMTTGAASPKITDSGNKFVFRNWPHSLQQVVKTADSINDVFIKSHGMKKVALILEDYAWTKGSYESLMKESLRKYGAEVVATIRYDPSINDFTPIFSRVIDSKAELMSVAISNEAGYTFVRQWGAQKVPAALTGDNNASWVLDQFWHATGGNCRYAMGLGCDKVALSSKTIPLWEKFTKKFGHRPYFESLQAYDAIFLFKIAMEAAGSTDPDAVVSALEKVNYEGACGPIEFDEHHQIKDPLLPFGQWQGQNADGKGEKPVVWPGNFAQSKYQLPPWL